MINSDSVSALSVSIGTLNSNNYALHCLCNGFQRALNAILCEDLLVLQFCFIGFVYSRIQAFQFVSRCDTSLSSQLPFVIWQLLLRAGTPLNVQILDSADLYPKLSVRIFGCKFESGLRVHLNVWLDSQAKKCIKLSGWHAFKSWLKTQKWAHSCDASILVNLSLLGQIMTCIQIEASKTILCAWQNPCQFFMILIVSRWRTCLQIEENRSTCHAW